MFEEPHLPLHPTTISYELATRTDDSMTGDDDDDPIVVVGSSDRSDSPIPADHPSLFAIAASLAVWDSLQSLPGVLLEIGSVDYERDIEVFSRSFEVFSDFLLCLL
jgi:hypothetical protein